MLSIRMRASRQAENRNVQERSGGGISAEVHISGAEGLYQDGDAEKVARDYIRRARDHSRGGPDRIVITIEKIKEKPRLVRALPVRTIDCSSPSDGEKIAGELLGLAGVSIRASSRARALLRQGEGMRGAALLRAVSGRRLDPDRQRGIRVSRLGITGSAEKALLGGLRRAGINSSRVKEALVLASKVALCKEVKAELCISDNPDYTTGYVSSHFFGYVRIPHIKKSGDKKGGRVFFIDETADPVPVINFLEKTPVMVNAFSGCPGVSSLYELICNYHK